MNWLTIFAVFCWLFVGVLSVVYERRAAKWLREREEREAKGLLLEVGVTLTLNGDPLTIYRIEGRKIFTTTSIFTERVQ